MLTMSRASSGASARPAYTSFKPGTSLKSLWFSVQRAASCNECAGGDREVEVPAAGAGQLRVQGCGLSGCVGVERRGLRTGEDLFLDPQLVDRCAVPATIHTGRLSRAVLGGSHR